VHILIRLWLIFHGQLICHFFEFVCSAFVYFQAFTFHSAVRAKRLQARSAEKDQRRLHVPVVDRSSGEPPPFVVVVQGPPQVLMLHLKKQEVIVGTDNTIWEQTSI
jgi:hypothetical protein